MHIDELEVKKFEIMFNCDAYIDEYNNEIRVITKPTSMRYKKEEWLLVCREENVEIIHITDDHYNKIRSHNQRFVKNIFQAFESVNQHNPYIKKNRRFKSRMERLYDKIETQREQNNKEYKNKNKKYAYN